VKPVGQQLVLPKSTMVGTNSVPLATPIGASCLLHGCLPINKQCIQTLKYTIREKKMRIRKGK
jgi:hypothetical protein